MQVHAGAEQAVAVDRDIVRDADEADMTAGACRADGLVHGILRADRLDHTVRTEAVGEFLDATDAVFSAFLDDVGRPESTGERLPVGMAAHRDDALRPELPGGEDAAEPHRAVTDDGDGLARPDFCGDGGEPARAEDV